VCSNYPGGSGRRKVRAFGPASLWGAQQWDGFEGQLCLCAIGRWWLSGCECTCGPSLRPPPPTEDSSRLPVPGRSDAQIEGDQPVRNDHGPKFTQLANHGSELVRVQRFVVGLWRAPAKELFDGGNDPRTAFRSIADRSLRRMRNAHSSENDQITRLGPGGGKTASASEASGSFMGGY